MPEQMQKTRNESDHPWLRKRPKTIKNLPKLKLAIFHQFLDVFSAQDGPINFQSFIFDLLRGLGNFDRPCAMAVGYLEKTDKSENVLVLSIQSYPHAHINRF